MLSLSKRDIVCFSNDWGGDPLSKTHIMRILARENRVLWVNSLGNRAAQVNRADIRKSLAKVSDALMGLKDPEPNIHVLTPLYVPLFGNGTIERVNSSALRLQVRAAMSRLGMRNAISWSFLPSAASVAGSLGESLVIYHAVDEFSAFSDASPHVSILEKRMLNRADLVLVSSEKLLLDKKVFNPRISLVRHGVDHAHFSKALDKSGPIPSQLRALPRPIIGFFGLIADWLDLELIRQLADTFPKSSIVMLGKVVTPIEILKGAPNIHFFGRRPYDELPGWCRGFDVAITPFRTNALSLAANPLKAREYVAAGLPTICTDLPELRQIPGCTIANSRKKFIEAVGEKLQNGGPDRERSELIRSESWERRVDEILTHIKHVESRLGADSGKN